MKATLHCGDAREVLATLPAESVQCVATSPPYYSLRDYNCAGQIGLESRPDCLGWATREPCGECYVCVMVDVFRGVRRVLRADGTCWLNLGDSYAGSSMSGGTGSGTIAGTQQGNRCGTDLRFSKPRGTGKAKDLMLIPHRVALALQADGWWIRMDNVWDKPNPMPESVTDRPTRAHEYVFLMAKSVRYYYDAEAVREPMAPASVERYAYAFGGAKNEHLYAEGRRTGGRTPVVGVREATDGRNRRSVWRINTSPYPEAHFAVFPEELAEICIKAGTSERGCCAACGAPWARVVERGPLIEQRQSPGQAAHLTPQGYLRAGKSRCGVNESVAFLGWEPGCTCDAGEPIPCVVLDPFSGAGTTGVVAGKLFRDYIGIELNSAYVEMSERRILQEVGPLLVSVEVVDVGQEATA